MSLRKTAMQIRPLVRVVQFLVTGEINPRRWPLLANAIKREPVGLLVDLGCGAAPLLNYISPARYVGVDEDVGEIRRARKKFRNANYTFISDDLETLDLRQWKGADIVALSSVTHHLSDDAVTMLFRRIANDIVPKVIYLQDATPTGPIGRLASFLDAGNHLRTERQLSSLLNDQYRIERLWTYTNPLRSFHQFLLRLTTSKNTLG
jgi:SAM-dependent methyltransferase